MTIIVNRNLKSVAQYVDASTSSLFMRFSSNAKNKQAALDNTREK